MHEINARKGEGPTNIPKVPIKKMKNIDQDGFVDKSDIKSSKVWAHFLLNSTDSLAKCKYCSVILKMHGTKSLHNHLERIHSILRLPKLNEESKENDFEDLESSQIDSEMPEVSEINQEDLLPENPSNEPVYIEHGTGKEIKEEDILFEDISKNEETRSKLWDHYLYSKIYQKAKCTHCSRLLAVTQSSTKSLHAHLKSLHQIVVPRVKNNGQDEPIPPEPEGNTHFTCKFCGDTYGEDRFLQEHIKSAHEKRQQYECTLCDAILLGKDNF